MAKKSILMIIIGIVVLGLLGWYLISPRRQKMTLTDQIPFAFTELTKLTFAENICNIVDYGAVSDGETKNTDAFRQAITDCANRGGGKVFVPRGVWLTGAIHLRSNINLDLDRDAEVVFSEKPEDYLPAVFTRIEGIELYNYSPFIYANGAQNVAITGQGKFNGQGQFWQSWKKGEKSALENLDEMVKENRPAEERIFGNQKNALRPSFVQFINCKNIELDGFTIVNSPRWTIHLTYAENVRIDNLNVNTEGYNSDGIVIDSSKNILVENSVLATGDDTIAIKSGLNEDGWRVNRPSENIVIRNSRITEGHSAIAIGSEMSGGVKNVFINKLELDGIDQGICAKSVNGRGGFIENIWANNIAIKNAANVAFDINLNYNASTIKPRKGPLPVVRNFYIDNLSVDKTNYAIHLDGLKKSLAENINVSNLKAVALKGVYINNAKNINLNQVKIDGSTQPSIYKITNSQNVRY